MLERVAGGAAQKELPLLLLLMLLMMLMLLIVLILNFPRAPERRHTSDASYP
jgi:hypothetical protein